MSRLLAIRNSDHATVCSMLNGVNLCMCRADAKVLAVFGAGMQAREHIRVMLHVRPSIHEVRADLCLSAVQRCACSQVYIVNRTAKNAEALAHELSKVNARAAAESATRLFRRAAIRQPRQIQHHCAQP